MRRALAIVLALALLSALVGCQKEPEGPEMYIQKAQLTEAEENIVKLLGDENDQLLYDFVLDNTVQCLQVNTYELQGSEWKLISGGGGQAFTDPKGRLALDFNSLAEGLRVAIQSEHSGGSNAYRRDDTEDLGTIGRATSMLSDKTEIVYEQEIPLVTQILSSKAEIVSYQPDYYFQPEEYAKLGYEKVYAITIRFSQKSVSEQEPAPWGNEEETAHEAIELLDDTLTEEEKQAAMLQQAQQRLTEAINKMDGVEEAEVFLLNDPEHTGGEQHAVVWLLMDEGEELTGEREKAIRELVRSSLPGLKAENVAVTDEYTNLNRGILQQYEELLSGRDELLEMINQRIGSHRDGTFTEMPNHHPDWPSDFPPPTEIAYPLTQEDYVVSLTLYKPSAVNGVWEGGLEIWIRLDDQHYMVLEPAWFAPDVAATLAGETEPTLGFGNSGFYKGEPPVDFDGLLVEQLA